ncbi:site-specific integrase [Bacteroides thetaiotaomicron]|jgi:site-specific recombinase XerD|uniref:site-specific integrase n=1 Tax=Bacteroides thetaiotaomicron TaxID=818 RepID=UPI002FD81DF3
MLILGHIRKRCFTPVHHALNGVIGHKMEKLITHLTNLRRSQVTIKGYRLYLSEFLTYLNTNGVIAIKDITDSHILSFLSSHPTNKVNISSALRVLFRFWKAEHIMDDKLIICSIVTSLVRKNISLRSIRQPK